MSATFVGGPVPGIEFALTLVRGAGSTGAREREIYVVGEIEVATGSADGTAISPRLAGTQAALDFFGTGGSGAWLASHVFKENPNARVYGVPVVPLAAGTKSTGIFTFGGAATVAGLVTINLGGVFVDLSVPVGMTAAQACVAMDLAIDNKKLVGGISDVPVVASNDGATIVTVTAHSYGVEWNQFPISVVSNTSTGLTAAASGATLSAGAGVVGVGQVDTAVLPNALALIDTVRTPLLVSQFNEADGTDKASDLILDHLITKNGSSFMLYSSAYIAKSDTHSNLADFVDTIDTQDAQDLRLIGWNGSHNAHGAMAAAYAACVSLTDDLNQPRNGVVMDTMVAPSSATDFNHTAQEICLEGGICPGVATDGGRVAIVRYVTARTDLTETGAMDGNIMDVLYQVMLWAREETTPDEPSNIVPDGYEAYGRNSITAEGVRGGFAAALLKAEGPPYGYLYAVSENLEDMLPPSVSGAGTVQAFIPATCLRRVPGYHNLLAEFQHEVDGVA